MATRNLMTRFFMKTRGLLLIPVWALILAAFGGGVMVLWNWLMPGILGLATITFWQALGLFLLARILFGSFGGHRGPVGMFGGRSNPIHEKWMKMTPEQREHFIRHRKEFGFGHPFGPFGRRPFGGDDVFGKNDNGEPAKEHE